ncbi:hypothetical protein RchiOBHm_Chr2g0114481 [Rosa chinensis]|uniref:Uncharacterized protein n=1 Tax=Rosa chinensis TaxID=74649 RepID=A0A2P6RQT1_ROSCH|nr:hypothetical protein RchiOBHm_Chr2g0114481 [Rosa chinensis]
MGDGSGMVSLSPSLKVSLSRSLGPPNLCSTSPCTFKLAKPLSASICYTSIPQQTTGTNKIKNNSRS